MNLFDGPPVDLICGSGSHQGKGEACIRSTWDRWSDSVIGISVKVPSGAGS